jgi:hypothetical protein
MKISQVYEYNGTWVILGTALEGNQSGEKFGNSVSLNITGDRVAVGAPENGAGYSQVYEYKTGNWRMIGNTIKGEQIGDKLGWSVSLNNNGDTIATGAIGFGSGKGQVKIYSL